MRRTSGAVIVVLTLFGCSAQSDSGNMDKPVFGRHSPPTFGPPVLQRAQFSADGTIFLADFAQYSDSRSGSSYSFSRICEVATGKALAEMPNRDGEGQFTLLFTPADGSRILMGKPVGGPKSGYVEMELVLWDWRERKEVRTFTPTTESIFSIACSRDGQFAYTQHFGNRTQIWDVGAGGRTGSLAHREQQKEPPYTIVPVPLLPYGRSQVVSSWNNGDPVFVWDLETGKQVGPDLPPAEKVHLRGQQYLFASSPDGRYVCVTPPLNLERKDAGVSVRLSVYDLIKGKFVREIDLPKSDISDIVAASFRQEDDTLAVVTNRGLLHVWQVGSGNHLGSFWLIDERGSAMYPNIRYASFSDDGDLLLTRGQDTTMRLWDVASRKPLWAVNVEGRR